MASRQPPRRVRILFWLIMSCLSTYLAEGVSGAGLFPLLHPWWVFVCIPLYGLHLLVLARLVWDRGSPRLSALLIAGFVFGMYEAYITKVVWLPTWGPPMVSLGGIAVVETAVISFFWHPVLAFLIPVVAGECLLTRSRDSWGLLPRILRSPFREGFRGWIGTILVAAWCGAFQSFNSPSPLQSVLSGVSSFGIIALLLHLWFRWTRGANWTMRELLPGGKAFRVMLFCLLGMYALFGIGMRREVLPGPGPQAIVWAIYAVLFALLLASFRRYRGERPPSAPRPVRFSWRLFIAFAAVLTGVSAGLNLVPGNWLWIMAPVYWVFAAVAAVLFAFAVRDTLLPGRS